MNYFALFNNNTKQKTLHTSFYSRISVFCLSLQKYYKTFSYVAIYI